VAELLYYNIYLGVLPIGTLENPADDPSRLEPVRCPSERIPWVQRYLQDICISLEAIDAKVWVGDRERWIAPPGYKPRPVAASSEWLVSHSDWKRRSLAQRGILHSLEYSSDEDVDGPPRLRKQRDSSVELRTSGVPQTRQAKNRDLLSEFRTYAATR